MSKGHKSGRRRVNKSVVRRAKNLAESLKFVSAKYNDFELSKETELRLDVESEGVVTLQLVSGTAEIFGREIIHQTNYDFVRGTKVAIFTWHGCVLRLHNMLSSEHVYISHDTPAIIYMNVHIGLEQERASAKAKRDVGPICMIVGPADVGKSSLTRILLNYAVRMKNHRPMFINLDITNNEISLPGTVSATMIEQPLPIEPAFPETALVYNYGSTNVDSNPTLYNAILSQLARDVRKKAMTQKLAKAAGMVIDTTRYDRNKGIDHLVAAAKIFRVGLIFVLDCEKLRFLLMSNQYIKKQNIVVVHLPKSGGVVQSSRQLRFATQELRLREYFYGKRNTLHPHNVRLQFSDVEIFRVGEPKLPGSCRPAGSVGGDSMKLCPVEPSINLLHFVLAIAFKANVLESNVIGYVVITDIDEDLQMLSLLSTHPVLPRKQLILTELQYYDA